ncbi:MAG: hypothetical protein ABW098_08905 [Candidatus Thiodiazotropha sp.]
MTDILATNLFDEELFRGFCGMREGVPCSIISSWFDQAFQQSYGG